MGLKALTSTQGPAQTSSGSAADTPSTRRASLNGVGDGDQTFLNQLYGPSARNLETRETVDPNNGIDPSPRPRNRSDGYERFQRHKTPARS